MSYRMSPHRDVQIIRGKDPGHSPRVGKASESREAATDSAMLVNAVLKEPFPPVSLPKQEFMELARKIWEELGLPHLTPESPWYGYSLGQWGDDFEEEARLAAQGDWEVTGERAADRRVKGGEPNKSSWLQE